MQKFDRSITVFAVVASLVLSIAAVRADDPPPTPEDLERLAAIEAFTKKQIAANYPEKFKQAAEEFNVPVEVLMGISFAETRHEHLMWPEGELYSPENGMPRPFGIMSLWDNEIFGHSLLDAAKLINKTPDDLKKDPLDNMRGAAALLRKLYDENPKPAYAQEENKLESWKYALVKYCGIEEPDLAHQHAFDVYDWLSQGYNSYGITLPEVPDLDLKEMWEETKKIKEEQRKINEAKWRAQGLMDDVILEEVMNPDGTYSAREVGKAGDAANAEAPLPKGEQERITKEPTPVVANTPAGGQNWVLILGAIALCALALGFLVFRKSPKTVKK